MFVCCECCVLSGRGHCDELITRPEESYWLWCVVECDLETSIVRRPWPTGGLSLQIQTNKQTNKPVWHMPLLCVQWKTPDDGPRNCPKHVEFYFKK